MDYELEQMIKKKNDYLKKIEEKKRMMELINNPTIKDVLKPFNAMKRHEAAKKIQKQWRLKKLCEFKATAPKRKLEKVIKNVENIRNIIKNPNIKENDESKDLRRLVMVQRAVRRFLNLINYKKTKQTFAEDFNKELFSQIKLDKINELKSRIYMKIKTNNIPHRNHELNFQDVLNDYLIKYRGFMEEFPEMHRVKEDNISQFYKCRELLEFLERNKNLSSKFRTFPLSNQKSIQTKIKTNKIVDSIENKMWWYKYSDYDEFESSNILSEIDHHYKFVRKEDI